MNTIIWIAQGILAAVFLAAGLMKLTQPREALQEKTPYVEDFTDGQVKAIGTVEVLGAIGVVLPAASEGRPDPHTYRSLRAGAHDGRRRGHAHTSR